MEAILVIDNNDGLSENGILPWQNKNDLKFFYKITKNNVLIMSKNTYLSLPPVMDSLLKNRLNIVYTKNPDIFLKEHDKIYSKYNIIFTNNYNIHSAILNNKDKICNSFPFLNKNFNIYIIGGKKMYDRYIPLCKDIWAIRTKNSFSCDKTYNFNTEKLFNEFIFQEDEDVCVIKYKPVKQLVI
jgi:dihydrofolate reductase